MRAGVEVVVDVGEAPVALRTCDRALLGLLEHRFGKFLNPAVAPAFEFDITVVEEPEGQDTATLPTEAGDPADSGVRIRRAGSGWRLDRGDFSAEWSVSTRRGWIRQSRNPYSVDSLLRIVHTLVLSTERGFLLHASSAVRNGRAFVFTGPSGSGKTTMARLAPADATVLTDEISYVRCADEGYVAYGTPFSGEWGDAGEPARAPVAQLFTLAWGLEPVHTALSPPQVVRALMRNILFFAHDPTLSAALLDTACDFAARVPAARLTFAPDAGAWAAIR